MAGSGQVGNQPVSLRGTYKGGLAGSAGGQDRRQFAPFTSRGDFPALDSKSLTSTVSRAVPESSIRRQCSDKIKLDVMLNGTIHSAVEKAGSANREGRLVNVEAVMGVWIVDDSDKIRMAKARLLQGAAAGGRSPVILVFNAQESAPRLLSDRSAKGSHHRAPGRIAPFRSFKGNQTKSLQRRETR